jgi:hypothetical protein
MILTILKYLIVVVAVALGVGFLLFLGAMITAVLIMVAEDTEYPKQNIRKEELTDGDNEA